MGEGLTSKVGSGDLPGGTRSKPEFKVGVTDTHDTQGTHTVRQRLDSQSRTPRSVQNGRTPVVDSPRTQRYFKPTLSLLPVLPVTILSGSELKPVSYLNSTPASIRLEGPGVYSVPWDGLSRKRPEFPHGS